mgnify:FL=1
MHTVRLMHCQLPYKLSASFPLPACCIYHRWMVAVVYIIKQSRCSSTLAPSLCGALLLCWKQRLLQSPPSQSQLSFRSQHPAMLAFPWTRLCHTPLSFLLGPTLLVRLTCLCEQCKTHTDHSRQPFVSEQVLIQPLEQYR